MIRVWRIGYCKNPMLPAATLLAALGYGSTQGNGRWHTQGPQQVVYCGSSRALCQLEKRVHANHANPANQALMCLEIPDNALLQDVQALGLLPSDWTVNQAATQAVGDNWLAGASALGLWVPSYIERSERNLLLNPAHSDYARVQLTIERHPFHFDPRLF